MTRPSLLQNRWIGLALVAAFACNESQPSDPARVYDFAHSAALVRVRRQPEGADEHLSLAHIRDGRFHQPEIVFCWLRSSVSWPGGASRPIVDPAPMVAPAPTVTGATSSTPDPMKASSPITVWCLLAPS